MRLLKIIFIFCAFGAHAVDINPRGTLKAKLFPFEVRVESITGLNHCGNEVDPVEDLIDHLGQHLEEGSSDAHMGSIMREGYEEALASYRNELLQRGGTFSEKQEKLIALFPQRARYQGEFRTQAAQDVEFLYYLIDEFSKLEKAAMLNRALYRLDRLKGNRQNGLHHINYSGIAGRTMRLIAFMREQTRLIEHKHEPAFKKFVDAFLDEDVVRTSLGKDQIDGTRRLFRWLNEHNHYMYIYFFDKYQPFTQEEFLNAEVR